ncbi:MAG: FlgD immunoglobulin-like domain containing protein, partial [Candidatus Latescibacterota bacterium]
TGDVTSIALNGDYLYAASGGQGVQVIDVSDVSHPTKVGSCSAGGAAAKVTTRGDYAYVAGGGTGVHVLNLANPTNPIEVASYSNVMDNTTVVTTMGDFVVAAQAPSGVFEFAFSDPSTAVLFESFVAEAAVDGVVCNWIIWSDELIKGYRLNRETIPDGRVDVLPRDGLMSPSATSYLDREVEPGRSYQYTISAIREDGTEARSPSVVVDIPFTVLKLSQNYPNPFNPLTTISFSTSTRDRVTLEVFDVRGRLIATLWDGLLDTGPHEVTWDGRDDSGTTVSSGVYWYCLRSGGTLKSRSMVIVR